MPPSATATDYDAGYAHQLMEDLNMSAGGAFKRAVGALLMCAVGAFVLIAVLSYNPFDSTGDTAGIGGGSFKERYCPTFPDLVRRGYFWYSYPLGLSHPTKLADGGRAWRLGWR